MTTQPLTDALGETLDVFERGGEPLTTTDVADRLDLGRRTVYGRLERLADRGRVRTKKVGANARVWWRPAAAGDGSPGSDGVNGNPNAEDEELGSLIDAVEEYAIFSLDHEGHVRTWNPGAERIKGYGADEIVGEHFSAFYTEDDREAGVPAENLERAAEEGEIDIEGWRVRADGSRFWANVTITAIRGDDGELRGYAKVTRDMTDRREQERRLRRERELVRSVLETVPVGVGVYDADGDLERIDAEEETRAFERVEGTGRSAVRIDELDLSDPDGEPIADEDHPLVRVVESGEPVEDRLVRYEGTDDGTRWVSLSARPLFDEGGDVDRVVVAGTDVTSLKRKERQLDRRRRELQEELDEVFARIDDAFFALDDDWRITHVNDTAAGMVRLEPGELIGERAWDALPELDRSHVRETVERAMAEQEPFETDFRSELLDIWVEIRGYPSETGMSVYARDVSERKKRELELERYETIVETMDDGVYVLDGDAHFVEVNDTYCELTGYSREELIGEHCSLVIGEELWQRADEQKQGLDPDGGTSVSIEGDVIRADGTTVRAESKSTALPGTDGGIVGVVRDTSERAKRERELERYETIVETVDDGVYVLDGDSRFVEVNDAYCEIVGYSREQLLGAHASLVVTQEVTEEYDRVTRELVEADDRSTTVETEVRRPDGERVLAESRFSPLPDDDGDVGRVGTVRDVTERVERERELERFKRMVETVDDGIYVLDGDSRFVEVNDGFCTLTGYDREELIGEHATLVTSDDAIETGERLAAGFDLRENGVANVEETVRTKAGEAVPIENRLTGFDIGGGDRGRIGVVRDISEREEREARLRDRIRQQGAVTDLGRRALVEDDLDALFAEAAEVVAETLGTDYCKVLDLDDAGEELLLRQGVGWDDGIAGEATVSATESDSQAAYTLAVEGPVIVSDLATERRFSGPDLLRDHDVASGISTIIGTPDESWGILGAHDTEATEFTDHDAAFVQSVANILASAIDRHRRERELARQHAEEQKRERALRRAYEVIGDPDRSFRGQVDELLSLVGDTIGTEYATLSRVDADEYVFESVVAPADADLRPGDAVSLSETNCERAIATGETLALHDVRLTAPDLAGRASNAEWGISSYLGTPVSVGDEAYGTFCFYDTEPRTEEFSEWEVTFVELLGDWLGTELERQQHTDRLATLSSLDEVVRGIAGAVIEQSTREEIETVLCERLADTDSYTFAWVGEVDTDSRLVTQRAVAGAEDYLDGVEISVDPDDDRSRGPTGRAFRTGEVHSTRDVLVDAEYEQWRDTAREYGFRSSAAVPIVHEGTVYGVVNVYTERPNAFDDREQEMLAHLGEQVGHAIAAADRKQALMSDEVVELEYRIEDVLDTVGIDAEETGRVALDHTVTVRDDEFVLFGRADERGVRTLERMTEAIPYYGDLVVRDPDGDDGTARFQVKLTEPPVQSVIASLGGTVEEAVIEDGDYRLRVFLPPSADLRRLIDAMREAYPSASLLKRHQRPAPDRGTDLDAEAVTGALTDRQRSALEAAFHAGYFEWPRESSGEDVAASLDVAPPTFHQHLRKAERKVFEGILPVST